MRAIFVWFLIMVLSIPAVVSIPNADVSISPLISYEANTNLFNITINNLFKDEVIFHTTFETQNIEIINVTSFYGWDFNFTPTKIFWTNGSIETNSQSLFQFKGYTRLVNQNTTDNLTIELINQTGSKEVITIPFKIIDDITAPVILNTNPTNNSILKEGINSQRITIHAIDNETGIKSSIFYYWNCTNKSNKNQSIINLNCVNNTCTNYINISQYEENESLCFEYVVYNRAQANSTSRGTAYFDGTAPQVEIISPLNNDYVSDTTSFIFNASDNLASQLKCDLYFDNNLTDSTYASNNIITSLNFNISNISEGPHTWYLNCSDTVGWFNATKTRNLFVDRTPPSINVSYPLYNDSMIGDNKIINFTIKDNFEIDTVIYNSSLNTSELTEGTHIIRVNASDKAGNSIVKRFTFTIDKTAPNITIIAPSDNQTMDTHAQFVFNTSDNFAKNITCSLYLENKLNYTNYFQSRDISSIKVNIPEGLYVWYIKCTDEVGNYNTNTQRQINISDLSGPDIFSRIKYIARGEPFNVIANITDISGVNNAEVSFENNNYSMNKLNNLQYNRTIIINKTYNLGNYSLIFTANDTKGNFNRSEDKFTLIQGYIINFTMTPNPANTNDEIYLKGHIELDNGSEISGYNITIITPYNKTIVEVHNKTFNYTFNAPSSKGNYEISCEIETDEGFVHHKSKTLIIKAHSTSSSSHTGTSSTHRKSDYKTNVKERIPVGKCGDHRCNKFEDCNSCPKDCGTCKKEKIAPNNKEKLNDDNNKTDLEIQEDSSRTPLGIGSGTGFFRTILFSPISLILFLILIVLLLFFSYKRKRVIYI